MQTEGSRVLKNGLTIVWEWDKDFKICSVIIMKFRKDGTFIVIETGQYHRHGR